jgi:hypothetical protein
VIPEAQDLEALVAEPGIPLVIRSTLIVLSTIALDNQLCTKVHEIDNVWP